MSDQYDEQAAALLPCPVCDEPGHFTRYHSLYCGKRLAVAAALREAGREPHPDKDGDCSRCGLIWQEEGITDPHVCPPGFWTKQEAEITKLKAENERLRQYGRRFSGYESMPCPFCTWDNGKHISTCGFHGELQGHIDDVNRTINERDDLRQQLAAAQVEIEQRRSDNFELEEDKVEAQQAVNDMADEQIALEAKLAAAERERDEARAEGFMLGVKEARQVELDWIRYDGSLNRRDFYAQWLAAQADKSVKPRCEGCGNEIDPTTCWCGAYMDGHGIGEGGHSAIPIGCDCGRAAQADDKARGE